MKQKVVISGRRWKKNHVGLYLSGIKTTDPGGCTATLIILTRLGQVIFRPLIQLMQATLMLLSCICTYSEWKSILQISCIIILNLSII